MEIILGSRIQSGISVTSYLREKWSTKNIFQISKKVDSRNTDWLLGSKYLNTCRKPENNIKDRYGLGTSSYIQKTWQRPTW